MREISGAKILQFLRDGIAVDWVSLCQAFRLDPHHLGTVGFLLRQGLDRLREVGLVAFESDWERNVKGSITLSPDWPQIQTALGISLLEIAKMGSETMVVSPLFGRPGFKGRKFPSVFILMPFSPGLEPVYNDHIKKVAKRLKLTAKRADDLFTSHSVIADMWEAICAARIIVADCTGRNPNVFYEVGLAHTVGKSVILITQNKDDVPFDLRHLRYIEYEFTPRGMLLFEERLTKTFVDALGIDLAGSEDRLEDARARRRSKAAPNMVVRADG